MPNKLKGRDLAKKLSIRKKRLPKLLGTMLLKLRGIRKL